MRAWGQQLIPSIARETSLTLKVMLKGIKIYFNVFAFFFLKNDNTDIYAYIQNISNFFYYL